MENISQPYKFIRSTKIFGTITLNGIWYLYNGCGYEGHQWIKIYGEEIKKDTKKIKLSSEKKFKRNKIFSPQVDTIISDEMTDLLI